MEYAALLQQLREGSLEEGRIFLQTFCADLTDPTELSVLLADEALARLYTPSVSLQLAEHLIFLGIFTNHRSSHALGLKAKGDTLRYIGDDRAAMECLDAAGKEFLDLGDKGNWARSRISWIVSAAWLGRLDEALQQAQQAREAFLQLDELYWACIIDSNLAWVYGQSGRYQEALKLYENMLAIYPTLTDQSPTFIKRAIAIAHVNQAQILSWLGQFELACKLELQAQTVFQELNETSLVMNAEINLASFEYGQGYYGSALRRYYEVFDSLTEQKIENPRLLAELRLYMANCLVKLNRAQKAVGLAHEAVAMYQQLGISFLVADALSVYATALSAVGRLQEALVALEDARKMFEQGGLNHYVSATRLQQAELLLRMGAFDKAYAEALACKGYFDAQGLIARSVRADLVLAGAFIEKGQAGQSDMQGHPLLEKAIVLCQEAALEARRHRLQEEDYQCQYLLGKLFVLRGDLTRGSRHYMAAIAQIERILDDLIFDLSPSFLHTAWAVYEDMITLCLCQEQPARAFRFLEQGRSMALRQYLTTTRTPDTMEGIADETQQVRNTAILRTQYELNLWQERYHKYSSLLSAPDFSTNVPAEQEALESELKRCETQLSELFERLYLQQATVELPDGVRPKRAKESRVKRLRMADLQQQLVPEQVVLAYFLSGEELSIFTVTAETLVTTTVSGGASQLQRLLPVLQALLDRGGWPDPERPPQQAVRRTLNKLYQLLIAPVRHLLPQIDGWLTIVPYGPLHSLPFHALHDGSRFFIEEYQIHYLPASSLLLQPYSGKEMREASTAGEKRALVLGYGDQGRLRYAIDEAVTIATILGGCSALEQEATSARLLADAPGAPIVHVATHARHRFDAPDFSSLLLADGPFNAIDAFRLDLKSCELVTLSGCETGLSLSSGGDEQLGLSRAFLAAGAHALLISLWPVEDDVTSQFMRTFYQHLLDGASKIQALRAAQCFFLQQPDVAYTHPYYWAAFRLVGDAAPLLYRKKLHAEIGVTTPENAS